MSCARRKFISVLACAAALSVAAPVVQSQTYPTKPVRMLVGFAPGGPNDITARLVAQWLSTRLGQQVVVDNRPGAASNIAVEMLVRAPADGYTLIVAGATSAVNATLYNNLKFNFLRDTSQIAAIIRVPNVLEVHPSVPVKNVPELIAYAKANPGKINHASAGSGSPGHLAGELFKTMTGINMVHVPYRGSGPALVDLIGGQVQLAFDAMPSSIGYIKGGQLRALAVTTKQRSDALPDVPAVAEFVPGYEASSWFGISAPRNTPAEIITLLNREVNAALADPTIKARFTDLGGTVIPGTPADFRKLIVDETEKWRKVILSAKIKVD